MWQQPIKGLVALITGGSSGLGFATCKRLSELGAKVVNLDLSLPENQQENDKIINIKGDIRNENDIKKALNHCVTEDNNRQQPKLDVLVNCAGVANAFQLYNFEKKLAQRLSDFKDLMDINVIGTFNVIRNAIELLAQNPLNPGNCRGVIINTSSVLAYEGHEGQTGYSASQGAINSMTLPIARELSDKGIRCNTIACGFFNTPLVSRSESTLLNEFISQVTPCPKRLGDAKEFALLVESIIENQMINGEIIRLDGALRWPERG